MRRPHPGPGIGTSTPHWNGMEWRHHKLNGGRYTYIRTICKTHNTLVNNVLKSVQAPVLSYYVNSSSIMHMYAHVCTCAFSGRSFFPEGINCFYTYTCMKGDWHTEFFFFLPPKYTRYLPVGELIDTEVKCIKQARSGLIRSTLRACLQYSCSQQELNRTVH